MGWNPSTGALPPPTEGQPRRASPWTPPRVAKKSASRLFSLSEGGRGRALLGALPPQIASLVDMLRRAANDEGLTGNLPLVLVSADGNDDAYERYGWRFNSGQSDVAVVILPKGWARPRDVYRLADQEAMLLEHESLLQVTKSLCLPPKSLTSLKSLT